MDTRYRKDIEHVKRVASGSGGRRLERNSLYLLCVNGAARGQVSVACIHCHVPAPARRLYILGCRISVPADLCR